jgi:hypothetical protein
LVCRARDDLFGSKDAILDNPPNLVIGYAELRRD